MDQNSIVYRPSRGWYKTVDNGDSESQEGDRVDELEVIFAAGSSRDESGGVDCENGSESEGKNEENGEDDGQSGYEDEGKNIGEDDEDRGVYWDLDIFLSPQVGVIAVVVVVVRVEASYSTGNGIAVCITILTYNNVLEATHGSKLYRRLRVRGVLVQKTSVVCLQRNTSSPS